MNNNTKFLTAEDIKNLDRHCQKVKFPKTFHLVYKSQVPNAAFILLNGHIVLFKNKHVINITERGAILGVHELMNNKPSFFSCKIIEESELMMVNKSDLVDAIDNEHSVFQLILNY